MAGAVALAFAFFLGASFSLAATAAIFHITKGAGVLHHEITQGTYQALIALCLLTTGVLFVRMLASSSP